MPRPTGIEAGNSPVGTRTQDRTAEIPRRPIRAGSDHEKPFPGRSRHGGRGQGESPYPRPAIRAGEGIPLIPAIIGWAVNAIVGALDCPQTLEGPPRACPRHTPSVSAVILMRRLQLDDPLLQRKAASRADSPLWCCSRPDDATALSIDAVVGGAFIEQARTEVAGLV